MMRIVTGLFDRRRELDLAVEHLVQEFDVPRERVQVHALDADEADARSPQDSDLEAERPTLSLPEPIIQGYAEGMRRGGILLAAWVDDDHVERALGAYREYGAVAPQAHEAGTSDDKEERTRVRAYQLWEQEGRPEGRPEGRDVEFWDRARRAVEAEEGGAAARAPRAFAGETGAAPPEKERSPDR